MDNSEHDEVKIIHDKMVREFNNEKRREIMKELLVLADKGDANAMYEIAHWIKRVAETEEEAVQETLWYKKALAADPYITIQRVIDEFSPREKYVYYFADAYVEDMPIIEWLNKKAAEGHTDSMYLLYDISGINSCISGTEVENPQNAIQMLYNAALLGHRKALEEAFNLFGTRWASPDGLEIAIQFGEMLYERDKDPKYLYKIGLLYLESTHIPQNFKKAADYLRRSNLAEKRTLEIAEGPTMEELCQDYILVYGIFECIGSESHREYHVSAETRKEDLSVIITNRAYADEGYHYWSPITTKNLRIAYDGYYLNRNVKIRGMSHYLFKEYPILILTIENMSDFKSTDFKLDDCKIHIWIHKKSEFDFDSDYVSEELIE